MSSPFLKFTRQFKSLGQCRSLNMNEWMNELQFIIFFSSFVKFQFSQKFEFSKISFKLQVLQLKTFRSKRLDSFHINNWESSDLITYGILKANFYYFIHLQVLKFITSFGFAIINKLFVL